jgi:hypothetical protein
MQTLRSKLTYANVMVTILAFAVLGGGTAFAAKEALLPKNSVGAKQLKPGAVTATKLSAAVKLALGGTLGPQGAPGAAGARGAQGIAGVEGARGPMGETGTAGSSGISEPAAIDATAPEQPIPSTEAPVALDGRTSWTAPSGPGGILLASLEVTAATNGTGFGHECAAVIEIFDNGQLVTTVAAGLTSIFDGDTTPEVYRSGTNLTAVDILNSPTTQTITAKSRGGTAGDCAPGSKIDGMRIIVQPVG